MKKQILLALILNLSTLGFSFMAHAMTRYPNPGLQIKGSLTVLRIQAAEPNLTLNELVQITSQSQELYDRAQALGDRNIITLTSKFRDYITIRTLNNSGTLSSRPTPDN